VKRSSRKTFVLMIENREVAYEAFHSPLVAMSHGNIDRHPATHYFVAEWTASSDLHPTIIDDLGNDRECAEATIREWNRLERNTWIPEDSL
jgi:hypothetical protein